MSPCSTAGSVSFDVYLLSILHRTSLESHLWSSSASSLPHLPLHAGCQAAAASATGDVNRCSCAAIRILDFGSDSIYSWCRIYSIHVVLRRHDNDQEDFNKIKLAPTQEEVLCIVPPFLPANRPGSVPHQPPGSSAAHLETHFRCLYLLCSQGDTDQ